MSEEKDLEWWERPFIHIMGLVFIVPPILVLLTEIILLIFGFGF